MDLKYKFSKAFVLFLIIGTCLCIPLQAQNNTNKKVRLEAPELLASLDAYGVFDVLDANEKWVVWEDMPLLQVHAYNLSTEMHKIIQIQKGRGPGEVADVIDLFITDDNIYLLDINLMKMLEINLITESVRDIRLDRGPNGRSRQVGTDLYFWNLVHPKSLLFYRDFEDDKLRPLNHSGLDVEKEMLTAFDRAGRLKVNGNNLLFVTKNTPYIYIFDAVEKRFDKKVAYDEAKKLKETPKKMDDGVVISMAPTQVEITMRDFTTIPQKPNSLFLLIEGKTKTRSYEFDKLYEIDIQTGDLINTYELGIQARAIAANEESFFAITKQGDHVYRYRFSIAE